MLALKTSHWLERAVKGDRSDYRLDAIARPASTATPSPTTHIGMGRRAPRAGGAASVAPSDTCTPGGIAPEVATCRRGPVFPQPSQSSGSRAVSTWATMGAGAVGGATGRAAGVVGVLGRTRGWLVGRRTTGTPVVVGRISSGRATGATRGAFRGCTDGGGGVTGRTAGVAGGGATGRTTGVMGRGEGVTGRPTMPVFLGIAFVATGRAAGVGSRLAARRSRRLTVGPFR